MEELVSFGHWMILLAMSLQFATWLLITVRWRIDDRKHVKVLAHELATSTAKQTVLMLTKLDETTDASALAYKAGTKAAEGVAAVSVKIDKIIMPE